jgi:hypothetical protein
LRSFGVNNGFFLPSFCVLRSLAIVSLRIDYASANVITAALGPPRATP